MKAIQILWKLSGDDHTIIGRCRRRSKIRFAIIGALVAIIFVLCFISCTLAFAALFHSYLISVPVGIVFALTITNIYLLLLYTLSKNVLPHISDRGTRLISVGGRIAFICFFAVIVAKPLEAVLFSDQLRAESGRVRTEQLQNYEKITTTYFESELGGLQKALAEERQLNGGASIDRISRLENMIELRNRERLRLNSRMSDLAYQSNYYIQGIIRLNTSRTDLWLITVCVVFIFLSPACLRFLLPPDSNYYRIKLEIESGIVINEYQRFKTQYSAIFQSRFRLNTGFHERYTDPPFNTELRVDDRIFESESKLLEQLIDDDDR